MFTGPVGPVEVFFYWPEAVFGNFYWPGAIGLPLASSPGVLILKHYPLHFYMPRASGRGAISGPAHRLNKSPSPTVEELV